MSEQTALSTSEIDVYIPLLHEGTDVIRPTKGVVIGPEIVRVLATTDYDPEIEEWEFPPGSIVKIASEVREGKQLVVARQAVV